MHTEYGGEHLNPLMRFASPLIKATSGVPLLFMGNILP